jgi:integrase
MLELLMKMRIPATVHGFRSTFDDWASETTDHAPHIIDMALAHKISDATKAAYRRGDRFAKRRALMAD